MMSGDNDDKKSSRRRRLLVSACAAVVVVALIVGLTVGLVVQNNKESDDANPSSTTTTACTNDEPCEIDSSPTSPKLSPTAMPTRSSTTIPNSTPGMPTMVPTTTSPTFSPSTSPTTTTIESPTSTNSDNLVILAYYYPWYHKGDWSRHGYVGTPLLGLYGTDDPKVAEQHIAWITGAVDVLVVSWWGQEHMVSKHLESGLLQANNLNQTRFCILYESKGRLEKVNNGVIDFDEPAVVNRLIEDFQFLKDAYLGHERYFRLKDGRPVVALYVTRNYKNFSRSHLEQLQQAIGMDLFIIADEPFFFSGQDDPQTAMNGIDSTNGESTFEAYTAYNMFVDSLVREGESAWSYMEREALPIFDKWSNSTLFFPHVMPSYHDFRGHKPLTGGKEGFLAQLETMRCLLKQPVASDTPEMLFVTSFNEWWEGSTIEPAVEYGTVYLDALAEFKAKPRNCSTVAET